MDKTNAHNVNARAIFRETTIHKCQDDFYTIRATIGLSMTGTKRQLLQWLLDHIAVTKSEIWFLGQDEPYTSSLSDLPQAWKPALIITQRKSNVWTIAAFGRLVTTTHTLGTMEFLAGLLPKDPSDLA